MLLTNIKVAEILNTSVQSLKKWRRQGTFPEPSHKVPGGRHFYTDSDMPELVEALKKRNKQLLDLKQMSEAIDISYHNFQAYVSLGKISAPTYSKGGRKNYYHLDDIPKIKQELAEIRERLKAEIRRWKRVLVPIVVDEHDRIIDGALRCEIALELGIRDIPRVIVPGLTDDEKHDLRLIINICRRHLSREQVRQWIAWELQIHPDHSDRVVAGRIGVSPSTVGKVRSTVQVGQSHSRLGADGKYRRAVVCTETERQRKQAQEILQSLGEPPAAPYLSMRKLRRLRYEQRRAEMVASAKPVTLKEFVIHPCDFRNLGDRIPDGTVDLAICDPPWDAWEALAIPLGATLRRILKDNGIACVYTGVIWEDEWNDRLKKSLKKEWRVIAVHREPGAILYSGAIRHMYTSILVHRNNPTGVLPTTLPLLDVIDGQGYEKDIHMWQQPIQESMTLINSFTRPNALICDLTSGSGTVAAATAAVGQGRRFVGCEVDPALVAAALSRVAEIIGKDNVRAGQEVQSTPR